MIPDPIISIFINQPFKMTKYFLIFFLITSNLAFTQTTRKIVKDFDGDERKTVYLLIAIKIF